MPSLFDVFKRVRGDEDEGEDYAAAPVCPRCGYVFGSHRVRPRRRRIHRRPRRIVRRVVKRRSRYV